MNIRTLNIISVAVVLVVGLSSCFKEEVVLTKDSTSYNRPINIAAPIVKSYFEAEQLLDQMGSGDDLLVKTDGDGLLYIEFSSPFSFGSDDVLTFPRIDVNEKYDLVNGLKSAAPTDLVDTIPMSISPDQRFDNGIFNNGVMSVNIPAVNGLTADYTMTFKGMKTAAGEIVSFQGNLNTTLDESIDLAGSEIAFVQNPSNTVSGIEFTITIDEPEITDINPGTAVEVNLVLDDLQPELITGYFGTVYPLYQEFVIEFGFSDIFNFGELIQFKGMEVELEMINSFGLPIDLQLKDMFMIKSTTGEALELEFGDNNTISLEGAELADPIVPKTEYAVIDNTNSNIEEAINFFPDRIKFDAVAKTNPDGEVPGSPNFMQAENLFEGNMNLYFPFWFKTQGYSRIDTMAFDFSSLLGSEDGEFNPIDVIEYIEVIFQTRNGMPFDLSYQIYPMDENDMVVDSLFSEPELLLKSPLVDTNGKVDTLNVELNEFNLELSKDQIQDYVDANVKAFLLKSYVTSGGEPAKFVQMHNFNFIELKFMIDVKSTNN